MQNKSKFKSQNRDRYNDGGHQDYYDHGYHDELRQRRQMKKLNNALRSKHVEDLLDLEDEF